jgi:ribosomal protection tetracycline resistance protein
VSTLNLGILAHVDAGKTSLTERLLFTAGVIGEIGRVDDGSTQTDTLALERQRGITIKSAVASFAIDDLTVNLIDTPGHPDFIAEVERVLSVLDGVVLVISAVEGVQAQTRVLMRTLQRLRLPTLIFVNKIDRAGAQDERVLRAIAERLTPDVIAMGSATGLGTRSPGFTPFGAPAGEKVAYVRMFSGLVRTRDRVRFGDDRAGKVTAISVFDRGPAVRTGSVAAGQIGKLWGLAEIQVGDPIGRPGQAPARRYFRPPTLETVVVPRRPAASGALHVALAQLAEQDPLINLRQDNVRREILVSLYGEVQKEVIQATLADDFGIDVEFRETTTICIERPAGTGAAVEIIDQAPNPFLATVGLRVDPAPAGSGVRFRREIELGSLPFSFLKAIEETTTETLRQGLYGWQVTDCTVTLTRSGYWPRQSHAHGTFDAGMSSTAGDFRNLTPLVLMSALRRGGTRVCEPVLRFRLEIPADASGPVLPVLVKLGALPQAPASRGPWCVLDGEIPAAQVRQLEQQLPGLTRGEGMLETAFGRYRPVRGAVPVRPRSDRDPLNRKEYLLRVAGRSAGRPQSMVK